MSLPRRLLPFPEKEKGLLWLFDVVETLGAVEKQVAHLVFKAAEAPTGSLSKLLGGDQKLSGGGEEPEGRAAEVCPSVQRNTSTQNLRRPLKRAR